MKWYKFESTRSSIRCYMREDFVRILFRDHLVDEDDRLPLVYKLSPKDCTMSENWVKITDRETIKMLNVILVKYWMES